MDMLGGGGGGGEGGEGVTPQWTSVATQWEHIHFRNTPSHLTVYVTETEISPSGMQTWLKVVSL